MESKSGEKLLTILEYIIDKKEPRRLLDISRDLGINNSTALRYLNTLIRNGYVEQDPKSLQYTATYKICLLAGGRSAEDHIRSSAGPYLEMSAQLFEETAVLVMRKEDCAVSIDVVKKTRRHLVVDIGRGDKISLCGGAAGLLFLTKVDNPAEYLTKDGLSRETLLEELEECRQQGYAVTRDLFEEGVCTVAVPVFGSGEDILAAISVAGPTERMEAKINGDTIAQLKLCSSRISERLGVERY